MLHVLIKIVCIDEVIMHKPIESFVRKGDNGEIIFSFLISVKIVLFVQHFRPLIKVNGNVEVYMLIIS